GAASARHRRNGPEAHRRHRGERGAVPDQAGAGAGPVAGVAAGVTGTEAGSHLSMTLHNTHRISVIGGYGEAPAAANACKKRGGPAWAGAQNHREISLIARLSMLAMVAV